VNVSLIALAPIVAAVCFGVIEPLRRRWRTPSSALAHCASSRAVPVRSVIGVGTASAPAWRAHHS